MPIYNVKFIEETQVEADDEEQAIEIVRGDICDFYVHDDAYYEVKEVKE